MTTQREAEFRQRDLLHFTDSLMSDVKTLAKKQSTYDHEKTLAVLQSDDHTGINGRNWYGSEIWQVFEKHHLRFKAVFEHMG